MKKSKKKIIILIILLLILIILAFNYTYSRYISEVKGKGVIQVAKWNFIVNDGTSTITNIDLSGTYNSDTLLNNRVAPGTSGSFDIVIDAGSSEVEIEYNVRFENEVNKPSNLNFIYEDIIVNSIKELEGILKGIISADEEEKIKTLTIKWSWPYQTGETEELININDKKDTEDGQKIDEYQFDVIVTGLQMIPKSA